MYVPCVCEGLTIDDIGEGVEGHRISGGTAGTLVFETGDFGKEKLEGGLPWNDSLYYFEVVLCSK